MTGPSSTHRERRCGLTPKGQAAVLGIQLRESIAMLPELERHRLLMELRGLVDQYAPRVSRPVA